LRERVQFRGLKVMSSVGHVWQVEIDVEAEVRDAEAREEAAVARAAAEELRRFDALLEERARERQVDQGTRWKP
jgi:hypothetical protein